MHSSAKPYSRESIPPLDPSLLDTRNKDPGHKQPASKVGIKRSPPTWSRCTRKERFNVSGISTSTRLVCDVVEKQRERAFSLTAPRICPVWIHHECPALVLPQIACSNQRLEYPPSLIVDKPRNRSDHIRGCICVGLYLIQIERLNRNGWVIH